MGRLGGVGSVGGKRINASPSSHTSHTCCLPHAQEKNLCRLGIFLLFLGIVSGLIPISKKNATNTHTQTVVICSFLNFEF
nr:hypothetical protein [Nostoc sp. CreGUA01]